jgi:hypothetical protein
MPRVRVVMLVLVGALVLAAGAGGKVLRVGSYHGVRGQFSSIQAAVNAAKPGDWILVGPGDYKTRSSRPPKGRSDLPAGILMTTPDVYLRGMNRNTVIVDGTKPGSPKCSAKAADQNFGPASPKGTLGLNGILVWKAADVWVQNLTACNFLGGSGGDGQTGNEIWWNGGSDTGKVGGHGYYGSYLTATSTFYNGETTAAEYGIFSSNWSGGTWDQTYASNFNDSGLYIGGCQQLCDQVVDHTRAEYNALGYSGTNSGGKLVIENSEFDNNEDGLDTNSENVDIPPPQNGACPTNGASAITHTHSCWVFTHNYVHDNNNPNVPSAGAAAAGPVGTGMSVTGGRNDTVIDNRFVNNDAWGVIFSPYLDSGPPCTGGTFGGTFGPTSCLFDDYGNALLNNTFSHNGSYGHPTNGDFAELTFEDGHPTNCFRGNTEPSGASVQPASSSALQQTHRTCNGQPVPASSSDPRFLGELLCDSQVQIVAGQPASCPTGQYPRRQRVLMHPLPKNLKTMPNPCAGVPANPWCVSPADKKNNAGGPTAGLG